VEIIGQLKKVLLNKFKHQVELPLPLENLQEINYIRMGGHLKYLDLPPTSPFHHLIVVGVLEPFDGYNLPRNLVLAL